MFAWFQQNESLVGWLALISVATFFATVIGLPLLIVRLPTDYFVRQPVQQWPTRHPAAHALLVVAKNLLGLVLLLAALAMLVLPGQGLLMMLVGVMLLDFPGKRRLECWLITRRSIRRTANWIRTRRGRPPLQLPSGD